MSTHTYSVHLDGDEKIRVSQQSNHDAIYADSSGASHFGIVMPHRLTPAARVTFLRELSEAASELADEINLRDLEATA